MEADMGEVTASWALAGLVAGALAFATLAEAWCSEAGEAEQLGNQLVYVPAQSFQPRSDASGRYTTHIRGMVPVTVMVSR